MRLKVEMRMGDVLECEAATKNLRRDLAYDIYDFNFFPIIQFCKSGVFYYRELNLFVERLDVTN